MYPSSSTALVRRASIEELVGHRNRAMEEYERAYAALKSARDTCRLASPSWAYGADNIREQDLGDIRKELDRKVWMHIMKVTLLESLMDQSERKQFEEQLRKDPPVCTVDTITATVERLMSDADTIFRRGLVTAFQQLDSKTYKRNSQFKVNPKVARAYAMSSVTGNGPCGWQDFNHYGTFSADLQDIERVMYVLDGRPWPRPEGEIGIVDAIRSRCSEINRHTSEERKAETPYFKAVWYKKGSVHIEFKRPDLLTKANRLIAEHFGDVLADAATV